MQRIVLATTGLLVPGMQHSVSRSAALHAGSRHAWLAATLLLAAFAAQHAHAHALLYEVVTGEAVTMRLSFPDDDRPLFEPYQVFAPASERPFQVGHLNAIGEVTFRPDRAGEWRVEVTTADGHGARARIEVNEILAVTRATSHQGWLRRTLSGLGWLVGIFGALALWRLWRVRPVGT